MTRLSLLILKRRQERVANSSSLKVVRLGTKTKRLAAVPEVGKTYYAYDDGKIRPSREYTVTVEEIYTYNRLPRRVKRYWKSEVLNCHWLYEPLNDYWIKTIADDGNTEWFVRTQDGGWFSIGGVINCGRLDITGDLYKIAYETDG